MLSSVPSLRPGVCEDGHRASPLLCRRSRPRVIVGKCCHTPELPLSHFVLQIAKTSCLAGDGMVWVGGTRGREPGPSTELDKGPAGTLAKIFRQ